MFSSLCSRCILVPTVLFIASMLSSSCGGQQVSSRVEQHFRAAQQDQQAGLLDAAEREYRTILQLQPGVAEVYADLGLIYYAQAKFADSAQALATAGKLKPGMRGVSLWLGIDYVKLNQSRRSIPLLREAVSLDPADKQAQSWLGTALWDAGQSTAALQQLAKAAQLFPSDLDICFVLGEAYGKAADQQIEEVLAAASGTPLLNQVYGDIYKDQRAWSRAIAHYQLATQKDTAWKGAHLGLAEVYLSQEKFDDARHELQRELEVNHSSAAAEALLAEVALFDADPQGALSMLAAAIRISPDASSAAFGLPLSYATPQVQLSEGALEKLPSAQAAIKSAPASPSRSLALSLIDDRLDLADLAVDWKNFQQTLGAPSASPNPYNRAVSDFDRQQFRQAEASLWVWLETHPNDLQAKYLLAKTFRNLSLQALDRLLTLDPASYRAHQLLAQTYQNREEDDKALEEYRLVEQMEPTLPGLHFAIGHLLWKTSDPVHAMEELDKELQLDPDHAEANGEMGSILVERHQPEKAIPYLETALRAKPDLWLIYQQLGRAYLMEKNYRQAEAELKKALGRDPEGMAHYQLGVVYRAEGRSSEAATQFEATRKIKAERLDEAEISTRGAAQ
jgi:tetratricopeptide (TPR) repeat protein